jgi:hypothetical protein
MSKPKEKSARDLAKDAIFKKIKIMRMKWKMDKMDKKKGKC